MFENVSRISIIGGPGTGKSTLANNLEKQLELPVFHIDGVNYFPNWVQRDKDERDKIILEKINEPRWIIEGTYRSTLEPRVERSEIIIFLDYSTIARLKGVLSRYFKNKKEEKPEIPGCKEQMNLTFIKFTIKWRKKKKYIKEVLSKNQDKEIIVFKNRARLNRWYKKEFGNKLYL